MRRLFALLALVTIGVTVSTSSASAWFIDKVDEQVNVTSRVMDGTIAEPIIRTNPFVAPNGKVYEREPTIKMRLKQLLYMRMHCDYHRVFLGQDAKACYVDIDITR